MATASAQQPPTQPEVKVNVLNVCAPTPDEQKEIATALAHIPKQPAFGADFEISRGRSSLSENANILQPGEAAPSSGETSVAKYVRMRREFAGQAQFSSVQYSFSDDGHNMVETLVLRVRDPKDLLEVSLEDSASSVTSPAAMLAANTPASRVKLERFGKSSVVLARCTGSQGGPPPDQTAYEPLFRSASDVLANYRTLLGVARTVPQELAHIPAAGAKGKGTATASPKPSRTKPAAKK